MVSVRSATPADAVGIARVYARSWQAGHRTAFLWVLDGGERADNFYRRHGGDTDGATKIDDRPDMTLREHRLVKRLR